MRALYTAATGLTAQQHRIDNIANNLANVGTTGFKKSRENFEDLVYQELPSGSRGADTPRPAGSRLGTGTRLASVEQDFSPGAPQVTNDPLDVAILGRGFFAVEDPNGNERYTRNGSFSTNADGELVTSTGLKLTSGIQIPEGVDTITIDTDGTVSATWEGDTEPVVLGTIDLVDFVNPSGLQPLGSGLYAATPESGEPLVMDPADGGVQLQQGALESSNVDVAEELIDMIMAQRAYELTSKVIEAADETLQKTAALKR